MSKTTNVIIGLGLLGVAGAALWYYKKKKNESVLGSGTTPRKTGTNTLPPDAINTEGVTNPPPPTGSVPLSQGGLGGQKVEVGSGKTFADVEVTLKNIGTLYMSKQIDYTKVRELLDYAKNKKAIADTAFTTLYYYNQYVSPLVAKEVEKGTMIGIVQGIGMFYEGQEPTLNIRLQTPIKGVTKDANGNFVDLTNVDVKASSIILQ